MKNFILSIVSALICFNLSAQEVAPLANGYYVVVATYKESQGKEASGYAESLTKKGFHSNYGLEKSKAFVYVYIENFSFDHFSDAVKRMTLARENDGFKTAWVLKIKDGRQIKESDPIDTPEPTQPKVVEHVPVSIVTEYIPNPDPKPIIGPQYLGNTPVFLSVFRDNDKKVLHGEVKIIDTDRNKQLGIVKGNGYFNIPDPRSQSANITLIATALGYKEATQQINYKATESDTIKKGITLFGNYYMVNFPMEKITTTSNATLSGISFFNDAAIMTPASKNQLDEIFNVLTENPDLQVKINGHTNGNSRGDIVYMGPSKNYFALTTDRKTKKGSAKELSSARAEVIKDWLIEQGIDASRITTEGWGGNKPVFDSKSVNARKNGRVEIEFSASEKK
ncbi:MAG: OmpA family protein [Bacteroidetes bacterium]|nr:OmpA family protein [Bacteroidota bacterium]MBS1541236.1 OmpA family protein [Bacteroidota bacterium]